MQDHHRTHQLSLFSWDVLAYLMMLVVAAGIVLGAVVATIYLQERDHENSLSLQHGRQRADQEFDYLKREFESVSSDVLYLSGQSGLQRVLEGQTSAQGELEQEYARFAMRKSVYDQIRFLDIDGKEVIRVNYRDGRTQIVPADSLQTKADRYYYRDASTLNPGEIFISNFDLNVEHGQIEEPLRPVLRFLTPVADDTGDIHGLLALNYSGNQLLQRLNSLSLPGTTLLVNSSGQYIRGHSTDDAWGWLLGHSRSFVNDFPLAWQRIAAEQEGQFSTDEGVFTFRSVRLSAASSRLHGEPRPVPARGANHQPAMPLTLIAYLPPELQHAASDKLLRQLLWMYAGAMTLIAVVAWYWARSTVIRRRQSDSILASEGRLRKLSDQLLTVQEEERRSISRELHDNLGQQVTAISLDLRSAVRQQEEERATVLLERAIEETDHLLQSIHAVASRVRPSVLDDLGLHDAVESLISEVSQRSGLIVAAELDFCEDHVSPKVGENVYRIIQEALMNVVKHAETHQVSVAIMIEGGQLQLSLADQGVGFEPQQRDVSRLGILGMQERTELLGGSFRLTTNRPVGTRIDVTIPLQG